MRLRDWEDDLGSMMKLLAGTEPLTRKTVAFTSLSWEECCKTKLFRQYYDLVNCMSFVRGN